MGPVMPLRHQSFKAHLARGAEIWPYGSRRFLQRSRPLPDVTILLRQSIALSDANQNQLPGNSPLGKNLLATANAALSFVSNAIF
jgi:hypothetical protein